MRLLLITGAGASRNLNIVDSEPIVLMDGWAAALRDRFGHALSELLGLHDVVTGQDFEEHLGELTRWLQLKPTNERFAWMTSGKDNGRDVTVSHFLQGLTNAEERGKRLERALDESLFEHFGPSRFSSVVAGNAYNGLLIDIGGGNHPDQLICATTNYDRSLELALTELNAQVRTGFRYDGIQIPTLSADELGSYQEQPSVLYLHGAVGWYRGPDGSVVAYPAADSYRPDLGRPAVLYPSRNKTVEDTTVRDIWVELDHAIQGATHVFVLGHGLADDHLVTRLRTVSVPLAVTVYTAEDEATVEQRLPHAFRIQMEFSPTPKYDDKAIRAWGC